MEGGGEGPYRVCGYYWLIGFWRCWFRLRRLICGGFSPLAPLVSAQLSQLLVLVAVRSFMLKTVLPKLHQVSYEKELTLPVGAMLLFVYSDDLPDLYELASSVPECTSTILVQHLLAAADRFGMDRLKLLCEAKLCDEVTTETVATTLVLAEQHHCSQLKNVCLKFAAVSGNLGEMMKSEGFKSLEESYPSLLSELLETIAVVDEDLSHQSYKKRTSSSNIGLNIDHLVEHNGRRTRSRRQ